jgi:hypothetical protein
MRWPCTAAGVVLAAFLSHGTAAEGPGEKPVPGKERATIAFQPRTSKSPWAVTVGLAPDGSALATWEHSGIAPVTVWDVATGKEVKKLDVEDVTTFAFAPDGQTLAMGTSLGLIARWDVKTWRERGSFGKGSSIRCLAFAADAPVLASGHADGQVRVWDLSNEQEVLHGLACRQQDVDNVVLSPDGKALLSLPGFFVEKRFERGKLWHVPGGEVKAFQPAGFLSLHPAFTPDGKKVLVQVRGATPPLTNQVQVWDVASGRLLASLKHKGVVQRLAVAPGKNVAATYWETVDRKYNPVDWAITLWDVDSGKELDSVKGHKTRVGALLFSPDGRRLASYSEDGDVKLWDLAARGERTPLLALRGPRDPRMSAGLSFTAAGTSLAAWSGYEATVWWVADK